MKNLTRCYELYCIMNKNPDTPICEDKVLRNKRYMNQYIGEMKKHGVKFDRTPKDKELFKAVRRKIGSEGAVCREKRNNCSSISWKDEAVCPNCNKRLAVKGRRGFFRLELVVKKNEPQRMKPDTEGEMDATSAVEKSFLAR